MAEEYRRTAFEQRRHAASWPMGAYHLVQINCEHTRSLQLAHPKTFDAFMLFTPMKKLMAEAARSKLPMPEEGTFGYTLLCCFWRGLGVVAWSYVLFVIFFRRP